MKKLKELLTDIIPGLGSAYDAEMEIQGITMDSRQVKDGFAFVAIRGALQDGNAYIADAIAKGASVVISESPRSGADLAWIQVKSAHEALGKMASAFYDHPSRKLKLIGVTGTNGKTTVTTLLYELFTRLGYRCGLLSTVRNRIHTEILPATHTTPDAVSLNELLSRMLEAGCDYCFMECSSHAIHQQRIAGLDFSGGIFTNLSHDHLDYHRTFEEYRDAKKSFFDRLSGHAFALTNKDDRNGNFMLQNTQASRYSYALHHPCDFSGRILEQDFNGMLLRIGGTEAWFRLVGAFNASNLLAVYGTAFLLNIKEEEIIQHLTQLGSVAGRIDYVREGGLTGIVDYAHTPDALKNVLETINSLRTRNEQLITVLGCGGDRDATKRPLMAEVAVRLSDKVVLTSDNPRSEDPEAILDDMEKGIPSELFKRSVRITDRREAIKAAVSMSVEGDIILVAGKGHETYQEIKGVKHPFDDKAILRELIQKLKT